MTKPTSSHLSLFLFTLGILTLSPAQAQVLTPILSYDFNTINGSYQVPSSGTDTTGMTLSDGSGTSGNRIAGTTGPSGSATDFAFNNSQADNMGSAATTNIKGVGNAGNVSSLNGLQSFTITGWMKGDESLTNLARIISKGTSLDLGLTGGQLILGVNNSASSGTATTVRSSATSLFSANEWCFFAVTYDSMSGTVHFYQATTTIGVSDISGTTSYSQGVLTTNSSNLLVGNLSGSRPFDGYLDDISIYGSLTDASGALGLTDISTIYNNTLAVPEPGTLSFLLGGMALLLVRLAKTRRHLALD